jgi:N-acetyl-1-D-myo-inositol-2-amino-2-deoxy-alpha-D-glucopyranoside deacetylase
LKASVENSNANPKLLAVLAHPDDETFGMGGTLALYARRGCDVYLVCATHGEVGTVDDEYMRGYSSIGELRGGELRCAAEQLGLKEVFFLGYRDSGMPGSLDNHNPDALVAHSIDEVAGRIVKYIRALTPDVVLTFDPIGGYRHPDHIHIHEATNLAFERSDDATFHPESGSPFKPRALYYSIFPHRFLRILTRLMPLVGVDPRRFGRNRDIDLKALTAFDFPVHVKIDTRSVANAKTAASACHASQGGMTMRHGLMGLVTRLVGERENYMRAFPPVADRRRFHADLFDGV